MSDTVTVNIYSQFDSSKVLFSADVDAAIEGRLHLREALVIAVGGGANLRNANLRYADLRNADLRDADLCGANLRDANLRDANLCGADLRDANLRDANLCGADLRNANLRDADLCGANLRDANLRDANLCGADLRNANLRNADLCGADLCGADLCGADLYCATIDDGSKLTGKRPIFMLGPIGSESRTFIAYITDQGLRLRAGCFFGTREEFESRLESTHGTDSHHAKEYKAALSMIDAHCDLWTPEVEA